MNEDLKIIKNKYGEKMMHLCRSLFPTILEQPSVLSKIMLDHFEPTRFLYEDLINNDLIEDFKIYIYDIFEPELKEEHKIDKTPAELLSEAGYNLYECKTEEEIQSFKKYYEKREELCTFKGGRLDRCHVFFAVKKDVDNIKRKNFPHPLRQDEYGTSVISIQFTRDESHTLSIKNRYNHTVLNPDATFSNDLDNIKAGLTESFERVYGMIQRNKSHNSHNFEIPGYVLASDGKMYKYNYEIGNVYYCPNNIIIDNFKVKRFPKERYIVLDYFILDLKNGEAYSKTNSDSFPETINNIINVKVYNENEFKKIVLTPEKGESIVIVLDKYSRIIGLRHPNIEIIKDSFLYHNETLQQFDAPSLIEIGSYCFSKNKNMKTINTPKTKVIGDEFLKENESLEELNMSELEEIGRESLCYNEKLEKIYLPKLKKFGIYFLDYMREKSSKINDMDPYNDPHNPQYANLFFERLKDDYRIDCNGIVLDLSPSINPDKEIKNEKKLKNKISNITKNIKLLLKGKLQLKDLLNKGEIEDEKISSR